jgi:glucose-1-phosphate adenylyltransferase
MASTGIYVFNFEAMTQLLEDNDGIDFGRDIIPAAIESHRVVGYVFDDYWEDIGTIQRFYEVNLQMTANNPEFDFFSPARPIYTHARFLPGSEVDQSRLDGVLLGDGCRIHGADITDSVVGLRGIVSPGAKISRSIIMGADYYETGLSLTENRQLSRPNIGIGEGSVIEGAIIDKNARIGRNVRIRRLEGRPDSDSGFWVARDGLVIVPKNAVIEDGSVI